MSVVSLLCTSPPTHVHHPFYEPSSSDHSPAPIFCKDYHLISELLGFKPKAIYLKIYLGWSRIFHSMGNVISLELVSTDFNFNIWVLS